MGPPCPVAPSGLVRRFPILTEREDFSGEDLMKTFSPWRTTRFKITIILLWTQDIPTRLLIMHIVSVLNNFGPMRVVMFRFSKRSLIFNIHMKFQIIVPVLGDQDQMAGSMIGTVQKIL